MESFFTLILVVLIGALPIVILRLMRRKKFVNSIGISTALFERMPRYRDGAISYNQDRWGVRSNVEVENPYVSHNGRYQRRHSARRHKQTKPWVR